MGTRKKISLILLGLFLTFFVSMVLVIMINFREYGLSSAEERAKLTAEIVKGGLTAHMLNGMMDKRSFFLEQIESVENINSIWVARSPAVIKQYGTGFNNEVPRDKIDAKVLQSGKMEKVLTETATKSVMRVTIPYVATAFGTPDCLSCHDAKEGEVLGAGSRTIDISDLRGNSFRTVGYTSAFAIIVMLVILLVVNRFLKPYINIFYSIQEVMKKAYEGDYSRRVDGGSLTESKNVALMMNELLEKLERVFEEIEKKVYVFLRNKQCDTHADPLVSINDTIDQLSEIYKFKQTIESDKTLQDIYERIAHILKSKFRLEDFSLIEVNTVTQLKKVVYTVNGCHCNVIDGDCRANRVNAMVDSTIFDSMCDQFDKEGLSYLCLPYSISNEMNLIISIVSRDSEEAIRVRGLTTLIEDYISTARPAIVSKKLMQILNEMARVDQMTGMYNRKYLDEFADVSIPQALRTDTTYGVLMVDIDYFKMINDTYGHDVGDEAIRTIAKVIKECIRKSDIAIRFGGEEFLVLLYNCDKAFVADVAEKIRAAFSKQKIPAGSDVFTKTLSVGAAMFPEDSESIWKCIKFADISLYHAKNTGRNKVVTFDSSLLEEGMMDEEY